MSKWNWIGGACLLSILLLSVDLSMKASLENAEFV